MRRKELFHPKVFSEEKWAESYFERNKKNIKLTGKRLVKILKEMNFSEGKVLDVGCGFAAVAIEIAKAFPHAEITGIDLSEPLLQKGKDFIEASSLSEQITLEKADVQAIPFEAESFDVVINTFLLHIVEDPIKMLNEIERVTATNGKILISDLNRNFLAYFVRKLKTAYTLYEAKEVINKSELRKGVFSTGLFWWDCIISS